MATSFVARRQLPRGWWRSVLLVLAVAAAVEFVAAEVSSDRVTALSTNSTTSNSSSELTPQDSAKYRGAAVRLLAAGGLIGCGGMLIAPEYVLTTASCAQQHNITAVVLSDANSNESISVLEDATVAHPLYRDGDARALRYNLAILRLSSQVSVSPVALAPLEQPVGNNVIRVDLSAGSSGVAACSVLPSDRCSTGADAPPVASSNATTKLPSGIVCAGGTSGGMNANATSASAALLGTIDGTVVLVGLLVGAGHDPSAASYASVRDAANFINANVRDHKWLYGPPTSGRESLYWSFVNLRATKDGLNFCGGVLVAPQFVLTAAHCVTDGLVKYVFTMKDERIPVLTDRVRIHPSYGSPEPFSFDAAILELASPATCKTATFDTSEDFVDGRESELYTRGTPSLRRSTPYSTHLPLWSRKRCGVTVPDVDDSVLCAGGIGGQDACSGDSGSPLLVGFNKLLIGVVSSGYGCGRAGVPGLYTRVAMIQDFIRLYVAGSVPEVTTTEPTTSSPTPSSTASRAPIDDGGSGANSTIGSGSVATRSPTASPLTSRPALPASSQATPSSDNKFESPLSKEPLLTTSGLTKDKMGSWLLGDDVGALTVSSDLRSRLVSRYNEVLLYSTGDLRGIKRVVTAHDTLPLNQRPDRFKSVSARSAGERPASAAC